jgi:hypothetical protein
VTGYPDETIDVANERMPRRGVGGIFSASPIARQLGVVIQTTGIAPTFAEVEAMLAKTKQDCGDPFRTLLRGQAQTSSRGADFRFVPSTFVLDS